MDSPTEEKKSKRTFKIFFIFVIVVCLITFASFIWLTYNVDTEFTMAEFISEFHYGNAITFESIRPQYLDRDLYIIDTISQIEYLNGDTGINLNSSGRYTNLSEPGFLLNMYYFDTAFEGNLTDRFQVGDEVIITARITKWGDNYRFEFTDIEHSD